MATDRASFGSFLFTAPAASRRTRAASLGCTPRTRSPAAASCRASRCPSPQRPPLPRTARATPPPTPADSRPAPPRPAPAAGPAAAHRPRWPRPCGRPRRAHADHHHCHDLPPALASDNWTAAGMPYSRQSASHLLQATPRQDPVGRHVVRKPGQQSQPAADLRAKPTRPLTPQLDSAVTSIEAADGARAAGERRLSLMRGQPLTLPHALRYRRVAHGKNLVQADWRGE